MTAGRPPHRAAPRPRRLFPGAPILVVALATALGGLLATACSQQPMPASEAAREVAATRAAAAATDAARAADAAAKERAAQEKAARGETEERRRREEDESGHRNTIVLDPGGAAQPRTPGELAEATRRERERYGDRSVGEVNDENLAELASRGKVTFAGSSVAGGGIDAAADGTAGEAGKDDSASGDGTAATGSAGAAAADAPPVDDATCGETCWRRRAYDLRKAWSESVTKIDDLQARVSDLRWRFYAEDDPWKRDSQIKPAWDRALDELRRTRDEADRYRQRVDELMDEGRRAGALPGWLREGIELEPKPADEKTERDPAEPVEPTVMKDGSVEPKQQ